MQKTILNKLMFAKKLKYSEVHDIFDNHDLFNYHLRQLVEKGYIEKKKSYYYLTAKGKQTVSHMEEDGEYQKQFKVGMFIDVVRKKGTKQQLLLHKRLKHPHYGYIGVVTGKLRWGESIEDNAKRELMEEVGIEAKSPEIIGVVREVFRDKSNKKVGDGVFFVIVVEDWKGDIAEKGPEGEYFWYDIDAILSLDDIFREGFESGLPLLMNYLKDRKNYSPYIMENTSGNYEY